MFARQGRGPRMLGMMGIILCCAVGFSAIRSPGVLIGFAVMSIVIASLLVAWFGAILSTPKAFWAGFAVVGTASLLLSSGLWLDDSRSPLLLPVAIFETFEPQQFRYKLMDFDRKFSIWYEMSRQVIFSQLAIGQALIGGLVGLGVVYRFRDGRTLGEKIGTRTCTAIQRVFFIGLALAALRFPESLWFVGFLQCVYIILFGLLLGSFIGSRRLSCVVAFVAATLTISLLFHYESTHYSPMTIRVSPVVEQIYTTTYPEVLDPDWWNSATVISQQWSWRSELLGGPAGPDFIVNRGVVFRWYKMSDLTYTEKLVRMKHFVHFSVVVVHILALAAATVAFVACEWAISRRRRDEPLPAPVDAENRDAGVVSP